MNSSTQTSDHLIFSNNRSGTLRPLTLSTSSGPALAVTFTLREQPPTPVGFRHHVAPSIAMTPSVPLPNSPLVTRRGVRWGTECSPLCMEGMRPQNTFDTSQQPHQAADPCSSLEDSSGLIQSHWGMAGGSASHHLGLLCRGQQCMCTLCPASVCGLGVRVHLVDIYQVSAVMALNLNNSKFVVDVYIEP